MERNNWKDLMSLIKLSIQKESLSAKVFSSLLHLHIRSPVLARPPLPAPTRLSLKPISATTLQRPVAVLTARVTFVTLTFTAASFPLLSHHSSSAHTSMAAPPEPHTDISSSPAQGPSGFSRRAPSSASVLAGPRGGPLGLWG